MDPPQRIRLEIDALVLERLLRNNQIHGEEFRCLDGDSKRCVWRLILSGCNRITGSEFTCDRRCDKCGVAYRPDAARLLSWNPG